MFHVNGDVNNKLGLSEGRANITERITTTDIVGSCDSFCYFKRI